MPASVPSWLRSVRDVLESRPRRGRKAKRRDPQASFRPSFEALEERTLMTATPVTAILTADNHYGLYVGAGDGSTLRLIDRNEAGYGGNPGAYNWSEPETFTFDVNEGEHIYVIAWDDDLQQMMAGQFTAGGVTLVTNTSQWQYVAGGTKPGENAALPATGDIQTFIAGGGWQAPLAGAVNGTAPWGTMPGLGADVQSIWPDTLDSTSLYDSRYVIFRTTAAVVPPNHPPVAGDDAVATDENQALTIPVATLLANDTDPDADAFQITSVGATSAHGGTVSLNTAAGTVNYTPAANYAGDDTFTYTITDSHGWTDTATVNVTVRAVAGVTATLTADNHYGLYFGAGDGSTLTLVGRNEATYGGNPGTYNWSLPETFRFHPGAGDYVYVLAWNDVPSPQSWIGQFTLPDGSTLYSDASHWEYALGTGANPGETGSLPLTTLVQADIAGATLDGTWATVGATTPNGAGPWGTIPGLDAGAQFVWHDTFASGSGSDGTYVIYRTKAAVVPPASTYAMPTGGAPIEVQVAPVNGDLFVDVLALNANGTLTVGFNNGADVLHQVQTRDFGVGPLQGFTVANLGTRAFPDLILQGPDGLYVARNDGTGSFSIVQTLTPAATGLLATSDRGRVQLTTALLNDDPYADLVAVAPGGDEVLVFAGRADGTFAPATHYASGGDTPVAVVVGDFVGDARLDLAVGHRDGTVTFLAGGAGAAFTARPDLTVTGLGTVTGLAVGDFTGQGTDVVVSSSTGVTRLHNAHAEYVADAVSNGNFAAGLTGWTASGGAVRSSGGVAQLSEGPTLLTTLQQTFVIPSHASTLTFDLVSLGLEAPAGGVPDAFEVSLLDAQFQSLVPTWSADATSFFNANPGGVSAHGSGVTFDGRTVTLDISDLAPGTEVTLYFDLVGNPPGQGSTATIGNVRVHQAGLAESFTSTALAGPFGQPAAVATGDVEDDGSRDILVADRGLNQLVIYHGDGADHFTRSAVDLTALGSGAAALAVGKLTAGDTIDDVVVALADSNRVAVPLLPNAAPQVSCVPLAGSEGRSVALTATFTDADAGESHTAQIHWGDGSVSTGTVQTGTVTGQHTYADDGVYTVHVVVTDATGGHGSATTTATIGNTAPLVTALTTNAATVGAAAAGDTVTLTAAFADAGTLDGHTVTVDWGDATSGGVTPTEAGGSGTLTADHVYTQGGVFTATLTVTDGDGGVRAERVTVIVSGVGLRDRTLYVIGTDAADQVELSAVGSDLQVTASFGTPGTWTFALADVDRVVVLGGAGDDEIVTAGDVSTPVWLDGGAGDDELRGGAGDDVLIGGAGTNDVQDGGGTNTVATAAPGASFFVVDAGQDLVYAHAADGSALGAAFGLDAWSWHASGLAGDPAGDRLWVIDGLTHEVAVRAADGTTSGRWLAGGLVDPQGIASNGTDLWVVDAGTHTLVRFAGAAARTTGTALPASAFVLHADNTAPSDVALQGTTLWVTDRGRDEVFVYDTLGNYLGRWRPDAANGDLVGITAKGMDLYVADGADGRVYHYALAIGWRGGDRSAAGSFVLAAGNATAAGVAHPGPAPEDPPFAVGEVISDSIATPEEVDVWSFTATAGQTLYFLPLAADGSFSWRLEDDQGQVLFDDFLGQQGPLTLAGGTYTLAVRSDAGETGAYQFVVEPAPPGPQALPLDTTVSGRIILAEQADVWEFTGLAGQQLTFTPVTGAPGDFAWDLTGPDDTSFNDIFLEQGPFTLATTGRYTLVVRGIGSLPADYQFRVDEAAPLTPIPVTLDELVSGVSHDYDESFLYAFTAAAGQRLLIEPTGGSFPFGLSQTLIDPEGNILADGGLPYTLATAGTYQFYLHPADVAVEGSTLPPEFPLAFEFRLREPTLEAPVSVAVGETVNATIAEPFAIGQFTLTAAAGDRVTLEQLSGPFVEFRLFGPDGAEVSRSTGNVGPLTLAQAGAYTLQVTGYGGATGNYSFRFEAATTNPPVAITPDQLVNGTIAQPGEADAYLLDGTVGDQWYLQRLSGDTAYRLLAPSGATVFFTTFSNPPTVTLTETGSYRLEVTGNQSQTGDYSFRVWDAAPAATQPLTPGATIAGAVAFPPQVVRYSFSADAGQRYFLDVLQKQFSLSGAGRFTITDPDGVVVLTGPRDLGPFSAAAAGTYVITVDSGFPADDRATGTYSLVLSALPPQVNEPLDFGEVVTGSLTNGQQDVYTFAGTAGQHVYFDVQPGASIHYTVLRPDGSTFLPTFLSDQNAPPLDQSGTYTVMVGTPGTDVGAYQFAVHDVPAPVDIPLVLGTGVSGTLTVPGQQQHYTLAGTAGERLFLNVQGLDSFLSLRLRRPDGTLLASFLTTDQNVTLDQAGTWTVEVVGNADATGAYAFTAVAVPTDQTLTAPLNQPLTVALTVPGQHVHYTFAGTAGQQLLVDPKNNPGGVAFTLVDPLGGVVFANQQSPLVLAPLTVTGTYTLTATALVSMGDHPAQQVPFGLQIQEVAAPVLGGPDSRGTDFWLAFPRNYNAPLFGAPRTMQVVISAAQDTSGSIVVAGAGPFGSTFATSFVVAAGSSVTVTLPDTVELGGPDTVEGLGVHIRALAEVSVTGLEFIPATSDTYLALPRDVLGTDYRVLAYPGGSGSEFVVLATADQTVVTITPAADTTNHAAGVPFTVTLDAGQTYQLRAEGAFATGDLTGTLVSATHAVAVFAGNRATHVPTGNFVSDNFFVEQLLPVSAWGDHYVAVPLATRVGDVYRVLAAQNDTVVQIDGTTVATLAAGAVYETVLTQPAVISASHPVLVAQYATAHSFDNVRPNSDPSMTLLQPAGSWLTDYILTAPDPFNTNYVNVVVNVAAVSSVTLDGSAVASGAFTTLGSSGYATAQLAVSPGSHTLSAAAPFAAYGYGFEGDDGYSAPSGFAFAPPAQAGTLTLAPAASDRSLGTSSTVQATVRDAVGVAVAGATVTFTVSGVNSATGSAVTDAAGHATFVYAGRHVGTDTVTAQSGDLLAGATVHWSSVPPTVSFSGPPSGTPLTAGAPVVLSGLARAGSALAPLALVTVNGSAVDALDAAGNFYATVPVAAGMNAFTVTATDVFDQTATATLTLTGVTASAADTTADVTAQASVAYAHTTFNRRTNTLHADATLTNVGATALGGAVQAVFTQFAPADVTLGQPDGTTAAGAAYVTFDLGSAGLAAGASSSAHAVTFVDAGRDRFTFDVTLLAAGNRAPQFGSAPPLRAVVGQLYAYTPAVTDADGQALTYELTAAPSGMTIDAATGALAWTPATDQVGVAQVEVRVTDGFGGSAVQQFGVRVTATAENIPPVFRTIPATHATPGTDYHYAPTVYDGNGDALTFTLLTAPAGMSVDTDTGVVAFAAAPSGSYAVSLEVDDGAGGRATQSWVLVVGAASGVAATFRSTPPADAVVGAPYVYLPEAASTSGQPLTFALISAPAGASVDPATGRVDWTPTVGQLGPQTLVLSADDGVGGTAVQEFVVTVAAAVPDLAPSITSTPGRVATQGVGYTYQVTAFEPNGDGVTFALAGAPAGMSIDGTTGLLSWTPTGAQIGFQHVTVQASDPAGNTGSQTFFVDVRPANTAAVFASTPVTVATAGAAYRYLVTATDSADAVRYSLVSPPASMTVDARTGLVYWKPTTAEIGDHAIVVRATDDRGASADQAYTLTVRADTAAPSVAFVLSSNVVAPGQEVTITVVASDNVAVASRSLRVNGTLVALDASNRATYTPTAPGLLTLLASATDSSGNVGTATTGVRVIDPADHTGPTVAIDAPLDGSTVTYLTPITGTVTDSTLEYYTVEYARAGTGEWHEIVRSSTAVVNGTLATFDPTLLQNDSYVVRISAWDVSGNQTVSPEIVVHVEGNAKLGNFHLEYTDLQVPLAGIPITIRRIYDTLQADDAGDFGYGWTLAIADANLHETLPVNPLEQSVGVLANPEAFRAGTKVYLTDPDGKRVGFTFDPIMQEGVPTPDGLANPPFGPLYLAHFKADPGVFDTLDVDPIPLMKDESGHFRLYGLGFPYNPDEYTLTTKDGTRYRYNQFTGLQSITDTNGNQLTYTRDGIFSSTGASIQFVRDANGRITQLIDPAGNAIHYEYDGNGDLTEVTNQADEMTHYGYLAAPAHYLNKINQPDADCDCQLTGVPVDVTYGSDGRLASQADALGHASHQTYDLTHFTETVADPLGQLSTVVYDARGNVVAVTDPRGALTRLTYNADDRVVAVIDAGGFTTAIAYDDRGNVTQVTDQLGGTVQYTYNAFNKVVTTTDALGRVATATYDAHGNLTAFVNAGGAVTSMTRDASGRQTSYTNPYGETTTFLFASGAADRPSAIIHADGTQRLLTYNIYGEVTEAIDENGNVLRFAYDSIGRMISMTDAAGFTTTLTYLNNHVATLEDALHRVTHFEYDAAGKLTSETDPTGGVTQYVYDANDQLTREIDAIGHATEYTYDAAGNVTSMHINPTWTYEYDLRGNLTKITDGNGHVTDFTYDAANRLTGETGVRDCGCNAVRAFSYDAVGNLISETDANGNVTTYTYDAMNRRLSQTDGLGSTVHWTYDLLGNNTSFTDGNGHTTQFIYNTARDVDTYGPATFFAASRSWLTDTVDPLGAVTHIEYDAVGNITGVTDALGRTTTYGFDDRNQMVSFTDALGGQFHYTYDAVGNLKSVTDTLDHTETYGYNDRDDLISITDALGGVTQYVVDALDRVTSETDALGHTTSYVYNALDQVTQVTDPMGGVSHFQFDASNNLLGYTDATGQHWSYSYDELNRLVQETDPLGHSTTYTHDYMGNVLTQTDALGRTLTYAYDAGNRLTGVTDNLGNATHFTYDNEANLTSLTDADGNTTHYSYDAGDRLVQETDALGHSRLYAYNLVGDLTGMTDRNGRQRTFSYDALDRMTAEQWIVAGSAVRTISYGYDAMDNMTSAGDPDAAYHMAYDALDRLTSIDNQGTPNLPHVVLTYGYDAVSNLTSIADNSGVQVTSTYNANDWLTGRSWTGGGIDPVHVTFSYNVRGGLTDIDRFADGGGTPQLVGHSHFDYDALGNLTGLRHADGQNNTLAQYVYQFDAANQLAQESHHGKTIVYTYDAVGQLTGVTVAGQPTESYSYDPNGNRTGGGYQTGPNNQVLADGTFTYAYDNEGNLTQKTEVATGVVTTYEYDFRNRLVSVVQRNSQGTVLHSVQFVYDCFDRRIAETADGVTTFFVASGDRAWADYDAAGNVIARYLYGAEGADDLLARWRPGEGAVWYLADHLYSVRDLTDAAGVVIDHVEYDSFGTITTETAPQFGDRFKFTGREYDPATGLYYYRARFYDPHLGRFVNEDSYGLAGGDANFYRYGFNAPTNWIDPSGHSAFGEFAVQFAFSVVVSLVGTPHACLTDSGLALSWSGGIPFTDVGYSKELGTVEGVGQIPTPSAGWLHVQIVSCSKLYLAAWANGVFGEMATILKYFELVGSGQPVDCVEFETKLSVGSISDHYLNVKVGCTGEDNGNKYSTKLGLQLPSVQIMGWARGDVSGADIISSVREAGDFRSGEIPGHNNCFLPGTQIWMAGSAASELDVWLADNRWWIAALSIGIGVVSALAVRRNRSADYKQDDEHVAIDKFFRNFDEQSVGPTRESRPDNERLLPALPEYLLIPARLHPKTGFTETIAVSDWADSPAVLTTPSHLGSPKRSDTSSTARNWLAAYLFTAFAVLAAFALSVPGAVEPTRVTKVIEDVQIGDWVMAWDEETGQLSPRQVVQLFRNTSDHVRVLKIESANGSVQEIHTTDGHPFWVPETGWVSAGVLEVGDNLLDNDGKLSNVVSSTRVEYLGGVAIFNFEVDRLHTYFVASNSADKCVLVHNASRLGPKIDRGGVPSQARFPTSSSRFVKKPQKDPDVLKRDPSNALGHREHQRKHPECGQGRDYLNSAIETAQDAKYIRYDRSRGSPRLQFFLPDENGNGGGRFTVTSLSGETIYTHYRMSAKDARRNGFVPRLLRASEED